MWFFLPYGMCGVGSKLSHGWRYKKEREHIWSMNIIANKFFYMEYKQKRQPKRCEIDSRLNTTHVILKYSNYKPYKMLKCSLCAFLVTSRKFE